MEYLYDFSQIPEFYYRFNILYELGEGATAKVVQCEHKLTRQVFAAKLFKRRFSSQKELLHISEIIHSGDICNHPNVSGALKMFYNKRTGYLALIFEVMQSSLFSFLKIRDHPISEELLKFYLFQLLQGVNHLHRHGIFHRDIKPENILMTNSPNGINLKLADLGFARPFNTPGEPYTDCVATRWYLAPECILTAGYYGAKMDIWALGCVLYEMITLTHLFPGENDIDQIYQIHLVFGTPKAPCSVLKNIDQTSTLALLQFPEIVGTGIDSKLPDTISPNLRSLIKLMLCYDPMLRATTDELLEHDFFNDMPFNVERMYQHKKKIYCRGCLVEVSDDDITSSGEEADESE